ncbi:DNA polymerase III subunit gamma and tau [Pseudonocardia thermophila]|uniref:DNA polymerase III subunit gamma and tau n=1 Tax=Pseudonocardia thermophila TaxID=1848 RepID=UPI00248D6C46|nr:DNA polymerase III subunit gamma and tau [Pseudonocardia thermophila]
MALALYRKYRPAKFAEVVGQEHVTEPLRTALESGRINHAYLFSGPRGCGKTSSARILARSLNCEQGPTPDPCGKCRSCISLAPGGPGNIDVTELDAASHGGVDDTRELRDRAFFAPAESRYRVFIVDEAHMITTQGFNALLKIVEEPPEHLVFVFATTEPEKVLPTIRSRTHHYPFRLIPPGTLRRLMERICAEEGVQVEPTVYPLVVRAGGGSARDTLSVLDQLVAGAGPEGVTYERAVALLGVTDRALIDDIVDALAAGDRAAVFETVDRVVEAGHDPRRFASDLLQRLRDVLLLQSVPDAAARGLVDVAEDELARMVEQADALGTATLTRYCEILHTGLIEMRGATAPRLLLELLCARMLLPAASPTEAGLLERIERLERRSVAAGPATAADAGADAGVPGKRTFRRPSQSAPEQAAPPPAPVAPPPAEPTAAAPPRAPERPAAPPSSRPAERPVERTVAAPPQRPAAPPAAVEAAPAQPPAPGGGSELDAAAVRRAWSQVLAAARTRSRSIEAMLVNATVRAVNGDELVLSIGAPSLARRLSESRNADIVSAALYEVLGVRWRVRCEAGDGPAATRSGAAARQTPPRSEPPQHRPVPPPAASQPQRPAPPPPPPEPVDDVPPPPEPPEDEEPPEDDEYAVDPLTDEAAPPDMPPPERDGPEEQALRLLSSTLGAQPIDPR